MEMPGRRSNYSPLSQISDDQFSAGAASSGNTAPSSSGDGKTNRSKFDWDIVADHRVAQQQANNRIGNLFASTGLQRQSSGSSFGESSISGGADYNAQTLFTAAVSDVDTFGYGHDDGFRIDVGGESRNRLPETPAVVGGSSGKSWAQQTEESYQLQLALALRLSLDATCADDPNFLDSGPDETALRSSSSAEMVSHRFWVSAPWENSLS